VNQQFDAFGIVTVVVWAALLWRTLRTRTTTRTGAVVRSVVMFLLIAFGAVMLWNTLQIRR
jgi:ABC-type nickel/cobalt efflux system permease component RcnA